MDKRCKGFLLLTNLVWKMGHVLRQKVVDNKFAGPVLDVVVVSWATVSARVVFSSEIVLAIEIKISDDEVAIIVIGCWRILICTS